MDKDVRAWGRPAAVRLLRGTAREKHASGCCALSDRETRWCDARAYGPRQPHWRLMLLAVLFTNVVIGPRATRAVARKLLLLRAAAAADRDGWMAFVECAGSPEHATLRMAAIITQFEVVRQRPLEGPGAEPFDTNGGLCAMIRRPHSERFQQPSVNGVGSSSTMQGEVEE